MLKKYFILLLATYCLGYQTLNAQQWFNLGSDLYFDDGTGQNGGGIVKSMAVYNEGLYVGGVFTNGWGNYMRNIAMWNGAAWDSIPHGDTMASPPTSFIVYNNELYISGTFVTPWPNIGQDFLLATWDGQKFSDIPGTTNQATGEINAMCVYKGELYAGGTFNSVGGVGYRIAKWNGAAWSGVGGGIGGTAVTSMTVYNDELYVGGKFNTAGGIEAYNIARWDGNQWKPVGLGVGMYEICRVTSLVVDTINNLLYAGSSCYYAHNEDSTSVAINFIAKWDGQEWSNVGTGGITMGALSTIIYHNELYVGGYSTTGTVQDTIVARWNGKNWYPVLGPNETVTSFELWNDTLYVGGYFEMVGNDSIYYIAKWYSPPDTFVGIAEIKSADYELNFFPNPTKESFTIETHLPGTKNGSIRIYGLKGELVKEYALKKGSNTTILNTSGWAKGVYFCSLEVGGEVPDESGQVVQMEKMVVE